jgi:O-antigen/teichoic acid export membrane protein
MAARHPAASRALVGSLERTAIALVASSSISGLLGLLFWAVAAHMYRPVAVGLASAEIAAMILLANLSQLSLTNVFPRFLPTAGSRTRKVLLASYASVVTLALVASIGFVVLGFGRGYLGESTLAGIGFVASVVCWSVFAIQDGALTGLHGAVWVPVENISFSIVKIGLLAPLVGLASGSGIFIAWMLPVAAASIAVSYYLFARLAPRQIAASEGGHSLPRPLALATFVVGEYVGSVAQTAVSMLLPLVVVARLGARANAFFFTSWMIVVSVDQVLANIATSFIVESATEPIGTRAYAGRTLKFGVLIVAPLSLLFAVGAPYVLRLFGPAYAANASTLLRLIGLAMPLRAVVVLYLAFARLARRVRRIVVVQLLNSIGVLGLGMTLLGHYGITGIGIAYLLTQAVMAACVMGPVIAQVRSRRSDQVRTSVG